jgi:hypothetical protein
MTNQEILQTKMAQNDSRRKYEDYLSRIRELERSLLIDGRRADNEARRFVSQTLGDVSSLHSEIIRLKDQVLYFGRKITTAKRLLCQFRDTGMKPIIDPLQDGFTAFSEDFEKAINTIAGVFSSLNEKVQEILHVWEALRVLPMSVGTYGNSVDLLWSTHQECSRQLQELRTDLTELIEQGSSSITADLKKGTDLLKSRINVLEEQSRRVWSGSQEAISDVHSSEFELRGLFEKSIEVSSMKFRERLNQIRGEIHALRDERFAQMDSIRSQLASGSESIMKQRRRKTERAIERDVPARISRQGEITALGEKLKELEERARNRGGAGVPLASKKRKKEIYRSPKFDENIGRLYYRCTDEGRVECIFAFGDGTVLF